MIEIGSVAGVSILYIIGCLLKCAIEVNSANQQSAEAQNLLYLHCISNCLIPTGLPDTDRYNDEDADDLTDLDIDDSGDDNDDDSDDKEIDWNWYRARFIDTGKHDSYVSDDSE